MMLAGKATQSESELGGQTQWEPTAGLTGDGERRLELLRSPMC